MYALAAQGLGGNWGVLLIVYVVIFGGFWFLFMRPQKKEQKRIQAMIAELEAGDTVLTTSGFYGVVIDVSEEDIIVEFGSNKNCRIPMQKSAVARVEKASEA
ncbi:preprotein translocase subunit YajC [Suipraeoptans intestinalis]|uniref:Preprotein translocase subunit YajC n=1 Tax=Suipraeoptans intestinalis TaxID=2606628 RepID=A0A6N7V6H3_9FIRM|nr:preprotein translocase subunit YajC [Suipraeoptans intestinalis]MDD7770680.1 preprotein translocase subunit YajC [Suipraeoptans intestinalis]MDY3122684.1 preprotein translocase subunit YajC [Suipraeoptans intestinalis]MSR94802.1 preprotein translocase subunit YajC [Suipraeoptans intestinalis]